MMAETLRCPSQLARMAAAVALNTSTPSGVSRTCFSRTGSQCSRTWVFNRGRAVKVTSRIPRLSCMCMLNGVQHAPEHIVLHFKGGDGPLLLLTCAAVRCHQLEGVAGVPWSLHEARLEIGQPSGGDPGIVALEGIDAL